MKFSEYLNRIAPITSLRALNKLAGLPPGTINKFLVHARGGKGGQLMRWDYPAEIVRAICKIHGTVEIEGWRITCDPDGPGIFAEKPIHGREEGCEEVKDGVFEYTVPVYRNLYDSFDFYNDFFEKEDSV